MTKNELIGKIENGSDIMFDVIGRHFTILTWTDEGIAIGEQFPYDGDMKYYSTAVELVENYKIGEMVLAELAGQVIITDYT